MGMNTNTPALTRNLLADLAVRTSIANTSLIHDALQVPPETQQPLR